MKIVLINLPNELELVLGNGKHLVAADVPYGLYSIKAYLARQGIDCTVYDAFLENKTIGDCLRHVRGSDCDIVGLSVLTNSGATAFKLGRLLKTEFPEKLVVFGNLHASYFASFYILNGCADLVVHGEGEESLFEIADCLQTKGDFAKIPGISLGAEANRIVRTAPRPFIHDLSSLPLANLHADLERYPSMRRTRRHVKLITSRGCVNKCKFCAVHNGRKFRASKAERIVEEIELLAQRYSVRNFNFEESLFTAHRGRVMRFCELVVARQLDITWNCEGHVNHVDEALLKLMRASGCRTISYGIESGNQAILDSIGKNTRLDQIVRTVRMSKDAGLEVHGLFIIGLPGENPGTIADTIRLALELPLDAAQFAIFTPYPGTEFYEVLKSQNRISENLEDVARTLASWKRYSQYPVFGNDIQPIYSPDGIRPEDLVAMQKSALRRFYLRFRTLITSQSRFRPENIKEFMQLAVSGLKLITG